MYVSSDEGLWESQVELIHQKLIDYIWRDIFPSLAAINLQVLDNESSCFDVQ